jgi:hypothetical protein
MRPQEGRITGGLRLAIAGIYQYHLLHIAVTVPVIIGKVDIRVSQQDSLGYHLSGMLVRTAGLSRVTAIISEGLTDGNRANNIKGEVKLPVTLGHEIIMHGPRHAKAGIARLVKIVMVFGRIVKQFTVRKADQYDKAPLIPGIGPGSGTRG